MTRLTLATLAVLLLAACANPDPTMEESVTLTEEGMRVLFTTAYTPADLDTVRARLARRGYALEYTLTAYNAFDMLSEIGFEVVTPDGERGTAQTRMLGTSQPFGLVDGPNENLAVGQIGRQAQ